MRREHPRIEIVAAAGRKADIKADGLAAIEVGNGLRLGWGLYDERGQSCGDAYHRRPSAWHPSTWHPSSWHRDRLRRLWCPYTMVAIQPKCGFPASRLRPKAAFV